MEEPRVDTIAELAEPDSEIPELVPAEPDAVFTTPEVDETMLDELESLLLPEVEVRPEDDWTARREMAMAKTMSL